jgi:hypothetical protein
LFGFGDDHGAASVAFHNFTRLKRSCLRFHETQLASTEGNVGDLDVNANRGPQRIKRTQRYFTSTTTLKRKELLGDVLTAGGFRVITASDSLEAGASWKGKTITEGVSQPKQYRSPMSPMCGA